MSWSLIIILYETEDISGSMKDFILIFLQKTSFLPNKLVKKYIKKEKLARDQGFFKYSKHSALPCVLNFYILFKKSTEIQYYHPGLIENRRFRNHPETQLNCLIRTWCKLYRHVVISSRFDTDTDVIKNVKHTFSSSRA
jgi:hypothetical protein